MKPMVSNMEINTKPAKSRLEDAPKRFTSLIRKLATTEIRRNTNATPGPPCGNMENSLCTAAKPRGFRRRGKPELKLYFHNSFGGFATLRMWEKWMADGKELVTVPRRLAVTD